MNTYQNIKLEQTVLGAILIESGCYYRVEEILRWQVFYRDEHKDIFKAIQAMVGFSKQIDIVTVSEYMKADKDLMVYITELATSVASTAHVVDHALAIVELYMKRETWQANEVLRTDLDTMDIFEAIDKSERALNEIKSVVIGAKCKHIETLILENRKLREAGNFLGINTGFEKLNEITGGWHKTNFNVIAARPGMGKTAWMLASALAAVSDGCPVLIFSLEMGERQLVNRLLSMFSGVDHTKIRNNYLNPFEKSEIEKAELKLASLPLYIDDSSSLYDTELKVKIRGQQTRKKIELVFVDYIQKMRSRERDRERQVASCAEHLKNAAKDLDIPVVAFSQLNRKCEETNHKRPDLGHLRESGAIEQEADFAGMLYRKWYYHQQGLKGFEVMGFDYGEITENTSSEKYGELIVGKNRHGALQDLILEFHGERMLWK